MDFEQFMSSGAFEKALQQEEGEAAEGIDDEVFFINLLYCETNPSIYVKILG